MHNTNSLTTLHARVYRQYHQLADAHLYVAVTLNSMDATYNRNYNMTVHMQTLTSACYETQIGY